MRSRILAILLALALLLSLSACAASSPKIYEVRFELNGGTLVSGQVLQRIEEGTAAEAPEVEREGYVFDGWSEKLDSIGANTVAVAQWTPAEAAPAVYEVRFELNGGTLVSGPILQHIEEGAAAEAPEVERAGYVFDGWSEALDSISANTVAVALWTPAEPEPAVYEVRFELNGGTLVSGQVLQHIEEGAPAEAPEVERAGYVFDGWSEALDAIGANTVAVALWTPAEPEPAVYEVRFDLNGGTLVSGKLLQYVEAGGAAEAPEAEREGYVFDGWSEELAPITGNRIIAALWESFYRVSFDAAGGSVVSGETETLVKRGEMPEAPELERAFYEFAGWDPALGAAKDDAVYTARWKARKLSSEEIFDKISPSVVEISAYEPSGRYYSLGSGFFIDDSGCLVTNYHVIDGTDSGEVTLFDGSRRDILAVLDYSKALDLAVLQIDIADNPYLTISERKVTTGEAIYALGSSQGLTNTFSSGIVSTASREIDGVACIQTTAPISEGNSGGPLVDPYGEVVGVNSMTLVTGQNLNFAIDIHELEKLGRDKALTLAEVYALEYPDGASSGKNEDKDEGFYSEADKSEKESNDIFLLADQIENGAWIAGEISSAEDLDWFYLELSEPGDVSFEVYPYYTDDMDYLLCGILSLTEDDDVDLMDALMPTTLDGYDAFTGTIHFDAAGSYFLLLCVDENFPYTDPSYYAFRASW